MTLEQEERYLRTMGTLHPSDIADRAEEEWEDQEVAETLPSIRARYDGIVEALRRMNGDLDPGKLKAVVESMRDLDLGIDAPISFGPDRHQALQYVYFASVERGRWVPVVDWQRWARAQ